MQKKTYKILEKDKRYLERKHVKESIIKYNIKVVKERKGKKIAVCHEL